MRVTYPAVGFSPIGHGLYTMVDCDIVVRVFIYMFGLDITYGIHVEHLPYLPLASRDTHCWIELRWPSEGSRVLIR